MSACPSDIDFARAISVEDPSIAAHVASCAECARVFESTTRAIDLARRVPVRVPSADRREEMRTAILAASAQIDARDATDDTRSSNTTSPDARKGDNAARSSSASWRLSLHARWYIAAGTVVLAAGIAFVLTRATPTVTHAHGTIVAHADARYSTTRAPDEVVTLHDGTIDVEVSPLHAGERFRVITADTEIEVRGTAFEVVAELGHMTSVQVKHGIVEVRPHDAHALTLTAGESWTPPRTAALPTTSTAVSSVPPPDVPASKPADVPAAKPAIAKRSTMPPTSGSSSRSMATTTSTPTSSSSTATSSSSKSKAMAAPAIATNAPTAGPVAATRALDALAYDEGWAAMREGDFEHAASAFARVSILDPSGPLSEDASYFYAIALARAKRGEAIAAFRDLLARYPHSTHAGEANAMLGWLLVEAKQPAEAERRFRAAKDDATAGVRESARKGLEALRR